MPILNKSEPNFNMENVYPVGLPLIIGGILFGIGMVIAGGCATGTLMRIGEGFLIQFLTLLFFIIGSFWGAHDLSVFWDKFNKNAPRIFLSNVFGCIGALIIQIGIICVCYTAVVKWKEHTLIAEQ